MAPKDKDSKLQKNGVIYKYKCPQINCTEEYIGESGRTFGDRYKEHLKAPSPIHLHTTTTGHPVSPDCFSIVDRESQGMAWSGTSRRPCTLGSMIPLSIEIMENSNFHMYGIKYCRRTHQTSYRVTLIIPPPTIITYHLPSEHPPSSPKPMVGGIFFISLVSNPNGDALVSPLILPIYPPITPLLPYIYNAIFGKYPYLFN